ncbi:MAG: YcaO-like family protein [Myxococcales bacterium]|nr:YcaO-like family protein [Myxococcales bacterium]
MIKPSDTLRMISGIDVVANEQGACLVYDGRGITSIGAIDADSLRSIIDAVKLGGTVTAIVGRLTEEFDPDELIEALDALVGTVFELANAGDAPAHRVAEPAAGNVVVIGNAALGHGIADYLTAKGTTAAFVDVGTIALAEVEAHDQLQLVYTDNQASAIATTARTTAAQLASIVAGRTLVIACLENTTNAALLMVNQACLAAGVPVLFIQPKRSDVVVGPFVLPWRTPCLGCAILSSDFRFDPQQGIGVMALMSLASPHTAEAATISAVASVVQMQLQSFFSGASPSTSSELHRISNSGPLTSTKFSPSTYCPACFGMNRGGLGSAQDAKSPPTLLGFSDHAGIEVGGGVRTVGLAEAEQRAHAAFAALGVNVKYVHDSPPARLVASHPLLRDLHFIRLDGQPRFAADARVLRRQASSRAIGKGLTRQHAWCSAAYEWFEDLYCFYNGGTKVIRASYQDVKAHAIDMEFFAEGLLPHFDGHHQERFNSLAPIDWVWGRDLVSNRAILLPAANIYLTTDFQVAGGRLALPKRGSSGIAAGCSLEDAVLEGLMEVVEHDAWFSALATSIACPSLDLTTVTDADSLKLIEVLRASGYDLVVRNLTSDLGIAVLEAHLTSRNDFTQYHAGGRGCHLDPVIALRRALTEAFQCLCGYASGTGTDMFTGRGSLINSYVERSLMSNRISGTCRWQDVPDCQPASRRVAEYVAVCVNKLKAAIPRANICYYQFPSPSEHGIFVTNAFVSGVFDQIGQPAHLPERLLNYRRCMGQAGARFEPHELFLKEMPLY